MVKIAVEHPFTSVREALEKKGYQTDMLDDKADSTDYDVIVVRDQEDLADYHMSVSLVEAKGRTLYEIVEEVEERLVRGGKIQAPQPTETERKESGGGAGGFLAGAATGAVIGAAAGLLFAPKSGKELQEIVKEKAASAKEHDDEESGGAMDQVKEKANQLKDKTSDITEKAKEKADELKAKRVEKQEDKELKKQEKVVEKEIKEHEKAEKEHEKAEKAVEKEIKKADKEADKEKGGIEVVELGDASVQKDSAGNVTVKAEDKSKN
ncbi:YkuS family protein [Planococcus sp. ISL-110]|uniref:YkuS family protein n=1 Tax=Planococcus sp. ISL-110 TaxID=2819167 RepID=UPI001BE85275|nr:YkuS family protein [Planococcus sp. ISL-110]MBT2569871.1 YkuS family protein [Planococcus sp. ISL-110]